MTPQQVQDAMLAQVGSTELFERARAYACEYMDGIRERRVFPDGRALDGLQVFDEPLPDSPADPGEVLRLLLLVPLLPR